MHTNVGSMTLQTLLKAHGIHTIRELCQRTGIHRQQGWMLWHGKAGVGKVLAKKLHEAFNIPYDELIQIDPVPYQYEDRRVPQRAEGPRRPPGRPRKRPENGEASA
jgi:transcriptional regulator with XRE-family HTH domain